MIDSDPVIRVLESEHKKNEEKSRVIEQRIAIIDRKLEDVKREELKLAITRKTLQDQKIKETEEVLRIKDRLAVIDKKLGEHFTKLTAEARKHT